MATTKLTLSVDKEVILKAKAYADENNTSISKLVENYLRLLAEERKTKVAEPKATYSSLKKLRGIAQLPDDFDYKKELQKAMLKKYNSLK